MMAVDTRPVADILARYSTDNQNPITIDVQVEKCREWCDRNGYQVGRVFADEAESGMKETRTGYEACMMHLGMGGGAAGSRLRSEPDVPGVYGVV